MANQISINSMPMEIILPIGAYSSWKDVLNLRQCSKFLYHVFNDENFWERGYREKFTFVAARALMLNTFGACKAYLYRAAVAPVKENTDALNSEFFYKILEKKKNERLDLLEKIQHFLIENLFSKQESLFNCNKKLSEFSINTNINSEIPLINADCHKLENQITQISKRIRLSQDEIDGLKDKDKYGLKLDPALRELNFEFNVLLKFLTRAFILNVIKNQIEEFLKNSSDFNFPLDLKAFDSLMVYLQAISTESQELVNYYLYIQMITDRPDLVPFGRGIVNQMIHDGFRNYILDSLLIVEARLLLCIDSFKEKLQ
jgi:hypothetical protein